MVKSSLNSLKWSLCRHGSVSASLASTSEPPRVAVPTSAPPPKASTTFQWPTLVSPPPLLRPRDRAEPSTELPPPATAPAVPRRSARFRRAQSRTTSPSTSSYPSRARLTRSLAESASRPPGAIAAPRRSSALSSSFSLRPSSVQIDCAVSFLATHSSSPSLSPSVPAMPPPV